ncbi:MAG: cell wall hydrolase [Kiloniellales bacterium]|nr:cell wall hydrolase [Kiloniellales bacterium]
MSAREITSNGWNGIGGLRASFLSGLMVLAALLLHASPAQSNSGSGKLDVVDEIECLALNIYHEARGEADLGKLAVGHVVLNRVDDPRFPETICGVIKDGGEKRRHRCQFSWWCDGRSDKPRNARAWERSQALARHIFWGFSVDPTSGALWYHTTSVRPIWRKALVKGPKIGNHVFYVRENNRPTRVQKAALD